MTWTITEQMMPARVWIVVLIHEHGDDTFAYATEEGQLVGAVETMKSTLDELNDLVDPNGTGPAELNRLKRLLDMPPDSVTVHRAVDLYEQLYETYAQPSEQHTLILREVAVRA